jgi:hypothetical protein
MVDFLPWSIYQGAGNLCQTQHVQALIHHPLNLDPQPKMETDTHENIKGELLT